MQEIPIDDPHLIDEFPAGVPAQITLDVVRSKDALDGIALSYLSLGIPAAYVLKKLTDEALSRFSKWTVNKILSVFGAGRPPLIAVKTVIDRQSSDVQVLIIECSNDSKAAPTASDLEALMSVSLTFLKQGFLPINLTFLWQEADRSWRIKDGTLQKFRA